MDELRERAIRDITQAARGEHRLARFQAIATFVVIFGLAAGGLQILHNQQTSLATQADLREALCQAGFTTARFTCPTPAPSIVAAHARQQRQSGLSFAVLVCELDRLAAHEDPRACAEAAKRLESP